MPALPGSLALTAIADGASIVAADHRNNYTAIQTAMNALIALFSNGSLDGEAMVWDATNTKWVNASSLASARPRAPRVVTSTMAGGPPASPVDQDIWVATTVDANGTRWAFQYNAGSASASKWEFIGGPAVAAEVLTNESPGSTGAYVDLATVGPSITVARAGDYQIAFGGRGFVTTNPAQIAVKLGAAATNDNDSVEMDNAGAGVGSDLWKQIKRTLAAADVVKLQYKAGNVANSFARRELHVFPVRIT